MGVARQSAIVGGLGAVAWLGASAGSAGSVAELERLLGSGLTEPGYISHRARLPFLLDLDGFALVAPAGEIPGVWEAAALAGFDRLDEAGVEAFKENALAVGFVDDGKAGAIGVEARITLYELVFREIEKLGDLGGLGSGDAYIPRPAAAVATALAEESRGGFVKR